jgi:hypothetical protein
METETISRVKLRPNDESRQQALGVVAQSPKGLFEQKEGQLQEPRDDIEVSDRPSSLERTAKGAMTSVKNQAALGNCYTFSAAAALEGAWQISGNSVTNLSEEMLAGCSNVASYGNNGCNRGWMGNGPSFVKDKGWCSLRSYPYASGSIQEGSSTAVSACEASCSSLLPAGQVTGFVHVVSQNYLASEGVGHRPRGPRLIGGCTPANEGRLESELMERLDSNQLQVANQLQVKNQLILMDERTRPTQMHVAVASATVNFVAAQLPGACICWPATFESAIALGAFAFRKRPPPPKLLPGARCGGIARCAFASSQGTWQRQHSAHSGRMELPPVRTLREV